MTAPRKRRNDSTIIAGKAEVKRDVSATQILSRAQVKGSQKKAGESSVMIQGERIRQKGLGVSAKFAIAISTVIASFMFLFGLVIYNHVKGALEDEINAAGVEAARALAIPEAFTWDPWHGALVGTQWGGFEERISKDDFKIPTGELSDNQRDRMDKVRAYNRTRLQRLLTKDGRILDAVITTPDQSSIIASARNRSLDFRGENVDTLEEVRVDLGVYRTPEGHEFAARQFTAAVREADGSLGAKATIVLSEIAIQKKLAGVRKQVVVLAFVFIALGVGVAFVLGRRITAPIIELTHDVDIIAKGRLDHHPKVMTKDEIGVLARTVGRMAQSLSSAQEKSLDHEKQKHQLQIALEIQSSLFPKTLPKLDGYEVASHYHPGPEVGGDYYDAFTLPDGRVFLMVASASGKGIPAAMLTTMARSFTSALADREATTVDLFKEINRLLSPDLRRGMYVTALACVLDPKTGQLTMANAGHNPLILFDAESKASRPIHSDGIALGFDKGPVFDRSLGATVIDLKPGDRVVLCTPGLFGITNAQGAELGEDSFYRLVAREGGKNSTAFVNLLAHTLDKFADGGSIETDITFVTVKRI